MSPVRVMGCVIALVLLASCAGGRPPAEPGPSQGWSERGTASWYGQPFHGRTTASGEAFDMYELTAAHPNLPFGTRVRVVRMDDRRSVVVRINDRGPFTKGRIIDLSYAAAKKIGMLEDGIARVRLEPAG